jgi:lipid-binding SYLF domain-containing protein
MTFSKYLGPLVLSATLYAGVAQASSESAATDLFRHAGQSEHYFNNSYGYAIFPTIGKAGLVVGAAHGDGYVYEKGRRIGRTSVTQLSIGMQAGGAAYSQIIFFADKHALDEFTTGNFEFSADGASAGTNGADAGASVGKHDATTAGEYTHGVAVFTIAKGGLMYEAKLAGQKYSFKPTAKR